MLKLVLLNEGESKRKLQKIYAGKNLRMTLKSFTKKLLIQSKKGLTQCIKIRCVRSR